jgi:hypothetical protein
MSKKKVDFAKRNYFREKIDLIDPRFATDYRGLYEGPLFYRQNILQVPANMFPDENTCQPGYQIERYPGVSLPYNIYTDDYPYHSVQLPETKQLYTDEDGKIKSNLWSTITPLWSPYNNRFGPPYNS